MWIKAGALSVAQAHLTVVVKRLCKIINLPAVQSWIFSLHFEQVLCQVPCTYTYQCCFWGNGYLIDSFELIQQVS